MYLATVLMISLFDPSACCWDQREGSNQIPINPVVCQKFLIKPGDKVSGDACEALESRLLTLRLLALTSPQS